MKATVFLDAFFRNQRNKTSNSWDREKGRLVSFWIFHNVFVYSFRWKEKKHWIGKMKQTKIKVLFVLFLLSILEILDFLWETRETRCTENVGLKHFFLSLKWSFSQIAECWVCVQWFFSLKLNKRERPFQLSLLCSFCS